MDWVTLLVVVNTVGWIVLAWRARVVDETLDEHDLAIIRLFQRTEGEE